MRFFLQETIAVALFFQLTSGACKAQTPSKAPVPLDPDLKSAVQMASTEMADYVRLLDLGDTTVKPDGTTRSVYRVAYRLNSARARGLAEVTIPFNGSYETVKVLRARTIRKDGTTAEVRPEDIRSTSPGSEYLMYDDAEAVGFSMPAVEEGCILDYTFEKISSPKLLPGKFWTYWGFDGLAPVTLCRYRLTTPQSFKFSLKTYNAGDLKPTVKTDNTKQTETRTWEKRNLPKVAVEPLMPQSSEVRQWMEVSNVGDWNTIAGWFWGLAKPQLTPDPAIKSLVASLTRDEKTQPERARRLYDWICEKVRYVGIEFGLSAFQPHAVREVNAKLYGDCKDKSALLISMLGECGIKAYPALLKIDDHREIEKGLPTLNAFNHCIVRAEIANESVWLDPTAETCTYGDIPASDRGCRAMVVKEGTAEFATIPLFPAEASGGDAVIEVYPEPNGGAKLEMTLGFRGGLSQAMRNVFRSLPTDKRKEMAQQFAQTFLSDADLTDFSLPDANSRADAVNVTLKFSSVSFGEPVGNLLILPAILDTNNSSRPSPFNNEKRHYPIVNHENSLAKTLMRFHLPKGLTVQTLPDALEIDGGIQHFGLSTVQKGDLIEVLTVAKESATTVSATDYSKVRAYFDAIKKAGRAKLILKRD